MGKVLEFRRVKQDVKFKQEPVVEVDELEEDILAIMNDYSLTPSNRRYILENMLMDIDEQLDEYRKELERAELKLNSMVNAAEEDIIAAYGEFEKQVTDMTKAVKRLTRRRRSRSGEAAEQRLLDQPEQL
ncbi:hypothetical protein [Geomonas sp.]|uniref:hypothetical protein n=1 Tax=Geomonas sp. TaxID=2651584 RepID=UPI002B4726CB|nr:hypothetical protein [Geomonas sp.]HJV35804.1 hypothetical protein [Geomonas sp.]